MKRAASLGVSALVPLWLAGSLGALPNGSVELPAPAGDEPWTETVHLELYARGPKGAKVLGLTAADFEVFEDGRRVEISQFEAIEGGRLVFDERWRVAEPAASVSRVGTRPERQKNLLLVYVDNNHLSAFHRNRLLLPLATFLEERLSLGDEAIVVSSEGSLEVRQPLTRDPWLIRDALAAVATMPAVDRGPHARNRETAVDLARRQQTLSRASRVSCSTELRDLARSQAQLAAQDTRHALAMLTRFVEMSAGLPGRKILLYVSDGLPLFPGSEAFEALMRICGEGAEGVDRREIGDLAASFDMRPVLRELAALANSSRVSFFPLEAAGPLPFPFTELDRVNLQSSLHLLATETGGKAILNTTEFDAALRAVGDDLDTYYSLSYQLTPRDTREVRSLVVKARGSLVRVEHRRSFQPKTGRERIADRVLGTLLWGAEENPLGLQVEVGAATALDGSLYSVPLRLRIPLAQLAFLSQDSQRRGRLLLWVAARDRNGQVAPLREVRIPLEISAASLAAAQAKSYLYEVRMLMRRGEHTVAVALADDIAQQTSFVLARVPVGPSPKLPAKRASIHLLRTTQGDKP